MANMTTQDSQTPSTSSSPESLSPFNIPKKRGSESITSLSDGQAETETDPDEPSSLRHVQPYHIPELFTENITAKIFRTASETLKDSTKSINGDPLAYPETVPQTGPRTGKYEFREPDFWTCGFFPGSIYALLERGIKYPKHFLKGNTVNHEDIRRHLQLLANAWSSSLHSMASRTDTHDIGFIIMPALKRDLEVFGNEQSLHSIIQAAKSLATRYVPSAKALRSWDVLVKSEITVTDQNENMLVIIDSLCNLDLLFYAAAHSGDGLLADLAGEHARTVLRTHLRAENGISVPKKGYHGQLYSTCHVANIHPLTGTLKWQWTAQGYSNGSTWARGQAWAILGYAQTYTWTKDTLFLDAACGTAEYFLHRLESAPACVESNLNSEEHTTRPNGETKKTKGRYVPLWDFDAPVNPLHPLRDSSAGVIAANGLVLLFQALLGLGQDSLARHFLDAALEIIQDTLDVCLAGEKAEFVADDTRIRVKDSTLGARFDAILKHGTANNNQYARRRYADHGLVYGDYYLIEFGNRLLELGLV